MRHDVNKIVNKMSQIVPDGDPLNISDEDLIKNFQECAPGPSSLSDVLSNQEQAVPVNHPKKAHKKCAAPQCDSVEDGTITFHRFPAEEQRLTLWIKSFPNIPWKYCKSSRLCAKHFESSSYKCVSTDSNPRRKRTESLKKPLLRSDAAPTIWPNVPLELLKKNSPTIPRPTQSSEALTRRERDEQIAKEKDRIDC